MRKNLRNALRVLFWAEVLFAIFGGIVCLLPQYSLDFTCPLAVSAVRLLAVSTITVLYCRQKTALQTESPRVLAGLLLAAAVNSCILIFKSNSWIVLLLSVCCVLFYTGLLWNCSARTAAHLVSGCIAALVVVGVPILFCLTSFVQMMSVETVIQRSISPKGTYLAEVVESDQGALGGAALVKVRKNQILHLGFCTVQPTAKRVYMGAYGTADSLNLQWQEDDILRIDGKPYADF